MRKLLVVLVLCLVGIGFYRGWFSLSSGNRDASNKVDVSLTVDPDKARGDAAMVMDRTSELGDRSKDEVKSDHE